MLTSPPAACCPGQVDLGGLGEGGKTSEEPAGAGRAGAAGKLGPLAAFLGVLGFLCAGHSGSRSRGVRGTLSPASISTRQARDPIGQ